MSEIVLETAASGGPKGGPVLEIENLQVSFFTEEGVVQAVRGVDLQVNEGEVLGVVGESGSGKSVTMLAAMGLLPNTATITGSARFRGQELLGEHAKAARHLRGGKLAMIFQDPLTALNPVHRVGDQIAEAVEAHHPEMSSKQALTRALEMIELVGIPQPVTRARQFPHEFSGGMRQRAMIALAIANDPELLIADEPTTALDVTIQAQILEVLQQVQAVTGTAIVFITHDLGVIARLASRVQVMYAGRTAEVSNVDALFRGSCHPYTRGLLGSLPKLDASGEEKLLPIPGAPPSMLNPPPGCAFHPRCPMAHAVCATEEPALRLVGPDGQTSACHFAEQLEALESATDLPAEVVDDAVDKAVLVEEAIAVIEANRPKTRLSLFAVAAFVLGLLAPVLAIVLLDQDVTVRGGVVMLFGIPAVLAAQRARREIFLGAGSVKGRFLVQFGAAFAWIALSIWALYCFLWLVSLLPEAQP
ncbi:MAG: glutathione transport system ATP-binding protein [Acidimicrobiaceae bacterium]